MKGADHGRFAGGRSHGADERRDRGMDVNDVIAAMAKLVAHPADALREEREVRDAVVRRPAEGTAERNQVLRHFDPLWRSAVQDARLAVVGVPGGEHASLMAAAEKLNGKGIHMPVDTSRERP